MLKRAWFLLSLIWAALFLWNGSTKAMGIGPGDFALAAAPFIFWILLGRGLRFIAFGLRR